MSGSARLLRRLRQWPLAVRLAAVFAVVAVGVFCLSGFALYRFLGQELAHERYHLLRAKLEILARWIEDQRDDPALAPVDLTRQLAAMHAEDRTTHYWVFCSAPGTLVCSAANPALAAAVREPYWIEVPFEAAGVRPDEPGPRRALRVQAIRLPAGPRGGDVIVAVGGDEIGTLRTLRRFTWVIFWISTAGGLLTSLLGWRVARWGLQPVSTLARLAERVGRDAQAQRLPRPHTAPELMALTEAFNGALERLEQAYHRLETFNADVAHELRTPLAAMIGHLEVALSQPREAHQLQEALVEQVEGLRQLASMVSDMLFLARADHGERALDLEPIDAVLLCEQTAEFFEPMAAEHGHRLQVTALDRSIRLPANRRLLQRALSNLLANAVQYGESGQPIQLGAAREGRWCQFVVTNPGAPLPDAVRQRMFDRFYRADPARAVRSQHQGLGLSIVRAIAVMHGGEVFAMSAHGQVQVGLRLPLDAPAC